jgi:hypothetical protein
VIFLGVLVDQVSGQRKKKQQVPTPATIAPAPTAMTKQGARSEIDKI